MKTKTRKTKGKVQHKKRVRFLRLDYYRQLVTGKSTDIEGIKNYVCTDNTIHVIYESGLVMTYNINDVGYYDSEYQLKRVIKVINAYIGGTGDGTQQQLA